MSTKLIACVHLTSFLFQHAATQYPYSQNYYQKNYPQANYLQVTYQKDNYRQENYPQDNYGQENYPHDNYRQENYPQDNYRQENYPQDNYYRQHIHTRGNNPQESYSENYPQDLQGPILREYYQPQENTKYTSKLHQRHSKHHKSKHHKPKHQYRSSTEEDSDECSCSCSKCESPEPKSCCELVCSSCAAVPDQPQPQSNQRIVFLPYAYPLIIAGVQAPKKNDTTSLKLTAKREDVMNNENARTTKTQKSTVRITSIEITTPTTTVTTTAPTSINAKTTSTTQETTTTVNISGVKKICPNITECDEIKKQYDAYDIPKSNVRRMKYNHRYALVPITDELEAKLMLEMRKTKPARSVVRNAYRY